MDNITRAVNENEEALIDRFAIKNEPDEVKQNNRKQQLPATSKIQVTSALYVSSAFTIQ